MTEPDTADARTPDDLGATRAAMLVDWGSWDGAFNPLTASVCRDLLAIVDAQSEHVCVPLQGSGTFAVEAALGTLVPKQRQGAGAGQRQLLQAHRANPGLSRPRSRRAAA